MQSRCFRKLLKLVNCKTLSQVSTTTMSDAKLDIRDDDPGIKEPVPLSPQAKEGASAKSGDQREPRARPRRERPEDQPKDAPSQKEEEIGRPRRRRNDPAAAAASSGKGWMSNNNGEVFSMSPQKSNKVEEEDTKENQTVYVISNLSY